MSGMFVLLYYLSVNIGTVNIFRRTKIVSLV